MTHMAEGAGGIDPAIANRDVTVSDVQLFSRARTQLERAALLIDELRRREMKAAPVDRGFPGRLLDDAKTQARASAQNLGDAEALIRERAKEAER